MGAGCPRPPPHPGPLTIAALDLHVDPYLDLAEVGRCHRFMGRTGEIGGVADRAHRREGGEAVHGRGGGDGSGRARRVAGEEEAGSGEKAPAGYNRRCGRCCACAAAAASRRHRLAGGGGGVARPQPARSAAPPLAAGVRRGRVHPGRSRAGPGPARPQWRSRCGAVPQRATHTLTQRYTHTEIYTHTQTHTHSPLRHQMVAELLWRVNVIALSTCCLLMRLTCAQ